MRALPSFDPRQPPLRWLLRMPILLYGLGLGWLLGGRFVLLTVRGRKTGLSRPVVLEVLGPDPQTGGLFVASAWGGSAQWLRNLEACPNGATEDKFAILSHSVPILLVRPTA